jgi:transposase InsO family protein
MVGDITYVFTWEGWLYVGTVIDCATRKIVGWAMDVNYEAPPITKAINMAARNVQLPEGSDIPRRPQRQPQVNRVRGGRCRNPGYSNR